MLNNCLKNAVCCCCLILCGLAVSVGYGQDARATESAPLHSPEMPDNSQPQSETPMLATPLTPALLDNTVTAEWVGGEELSRHNFLEADLKAHFPNPLTWVVAMPGCRLGWGGINFGDAPTPGTRHLRMGFHTPIPVGTVITKGRLSGVSTLKPTAIYPGDLQDEDQWMPAERARNTDLSVWILPPGTDTRALRFTYNSAADEQNRAGKLQGVYVLADRFCNLAPNAEAFASRNPRAASLLTDGADTGRNAWSNNDGQARPPLSAEHSEWLMLVWPQPQTLRGLCAVWAVFGRAEVEAYIGPADRHPREALKTDWQTIADGTCEHRSPEALNLNMLEFGQDVTTRAVRLRILSPAVEGHYLKGQTQEGCRCMLGELLAFRPLGDTAFDASPTEGAEALPQGTIPITFSMPVDGLATLVIEDAQGKRVRNLVGDTRFSVGTHTVYWDGLDESGSIPGPYAGIYTTVGQQVIPGTYTVRGLFHDSFDLRYEFTVANSAGNPPWLTASHWSGGTGGWLADHSPPSAILHLPGKQDRLLMASTVSESNHGIIWTDLSGKKLNGKLWVGGNWTGASHLTRDHGPQAIPDVYAYSGIVWEGGLRLVAFCDNSYRTVAPYVFPDKEQASLGGLAVHNGLLFASAPKMNSLIVVDAAKGQVLGTAALTDGRGLAINTQGQLLALSGRRLLRYPPLSVDGLAQAGGDIVLPQPEVLIAEGLQDPQGIAVDDAGNIYVSDWGTSHQVRVFLPMGKLLRTIGEPGGARIGRYDPKCMDHPYGLTVAPDGHLWIAEASNAPKRVSKWTLDGTFVTAFYGPAQYGGGGTLDPLDTRRFYYAEQGHATGLEYALDWKTGKSHLRGIYMLPNTNAPALPLRTAPQTPIYLHGRQYMTDVNNSRPIGGPRSASIWLMKDGMIQPVASLGEVREWPILSDERFRDRWPEGVVPNTAGWNGTMYAWSDLNGGGQPEPEEVDFVKGRTGSLTLNGQLEFCTAGAEIFGPQRFTEAGAPVYDLHKGRKQLENFFMSEVSSGSGQVIAVQDGWTVGTGGPVKGIRDGRMVWTYPNEWPGQQAGVFSTPPTDPGELMATTHLMGLINPPGSDVGNMLAIDGDKGNVFLMTTDGLFVTALFHDVRLASKTWTMPEARRGMRLNDLTLYDEEFWSTATQTTEGKVYLVVGKSHSSIVRVDGLETIKRLQPWTIEVTPEQLDGAQADWVRREEARLALRGRDTLTVRITSTAPVIDGDLDDWQDDQWVTIDERSNTRLQAEVGGKVEAAVRVADKRLYLAWRTREAKLLVNGGDAWQYLFKTGGALDVMLGVNPNGTSDRQQPEEGDLRLLISLMDGRPTAVLYQPVAAEDKAPGSFSSPWRTLTFDRVIDLSEDMMFAARGGNYEVSVPLRCLGLTPTDGLRLRGDLGVLRGNGFQTLQRLYWQNKATSTVADVPTEATLTPHLWGILEFRDGSKSTTTTPKETYP